MGLIFAFIGFALGATSGSFCGQCKIINEKVQNIQLESDPGRAIDLMVELSGWIRKMPMSKKPELRKKEYLTLFAATFKLEDYDMDLEIPEILGHLYRSNKSEFLAHLRLLPRKQQEQILYRMKLVKIYVDFGEGKTYEDFLKKNPPPK